MTSTTTSLLVDAGISVVVPVLNGAGWLREVVEAIRVECDGRPFELLIVDDGSRDGSVELIRSFADPRIEIIEGPRRGAAAAVNAGVNRARFEIVAQVDQDVIVQPGWLSALLRVLDAPHVAAAQGSYVTDPSAPLLARVMSLDLEQRYARLRDGSTDHVCTGNVLWRRQAFDEVGGLDETLGYGYDNDLSYRLVAAGYRLAICHRAKSFHRWREGWRGYVRQQYGFGYGRIDLVVRHRHKVLGDAVSPTMMMAHPLLLGAAFLSVGIGVFAALAGASARPWLAAAAAVAGGLVFERAIAGTIAAFGWRDPAALLFPIAHLLRDAAWVAAILIWLSRQVRRVPMSPSQSMRPRAGRAQG
jgi:glycosyltransferase involved in cell wall biosynthesis